MNSCVPAHLPFSRPVRLMITTNNLQFYGCSCDEIILTGKVDNILNRYVRGLFSRETDILVPHIIIVNIPMIQWLVHPYIDGLM